MARVPGVKGNTYGIDVDLQNGVVKIADQVIVDDIEKARLFVQAYRLGREHKKTQIRDALN